MPKHVGSMLGLVVQALGEKYGPLPGYEEEKKAEADRGRLGAQCDWAYAVAMYPTGRGWSMRAVPAAPRPRRPPPALRRAGPAKEH